MRLRRLSLLVLSTSLFASGGLLACGGQASRDRGSAAPAAAPIAGQPVTVTLESSGGQLPAALFGGALYYAGQDGQQYAIRIGNNTAERVEVVVTVDGRDVVSGGLGDYRKQRGYIVEPFGQIVVDGFRQSLDQVAAFRFSGLGDSYTALQGTPQHAGVIGIAVFEERAHREKKTGPLAVGPTPADASPFPGSGGSGNRRADDSAREAPRSMSPEPFAGADASAKSGESAPLADEAAAPATSQSPGSFAPPPVPRNELGTQYGESQSSSVHEVEFKRKHKRKPDAVLAIYYDSARGLAARGIPVGGSVGFDAEPFPQRFPAR